MFSGFKMMYPTSTVQGHQNRDVGQATMGFKGITHQHTADCGCGEREVFNVREIKMPKMVVKNAPVVNPWYGMKHWERDKFLKKSKWFIYSLCISEIRAYCIKKQIWLQIVLFHFLCQRVHFTFKNCRYIFLLRFCLFLDSLFCSGFLNKFYMPNINFKIQTLQFWSIHR